MRCLLIFAFFKLICTACVIDCKHRPQWRQQQILYCTYRTVAKFRIGILEKESIIGVQWFQKNPNPRTHRSVGNSASLVSHWNGGPLAYCPHWTPMIDSIFSHTPDRDFRCFYPCEIKSILHMNCCGTRKSHPRTRIIRQKRGSAEFLTKLFRSEGGISLSHNNTSWWILFLAHNVTF